LGFRRSTKGTHFIPWVLGFKQCSLHRIVRVSRSCVINAFSRTPLSGHAIVPLAFRLKVGPVTHRPFASGLSWVSQVITMPLDGARAR
jgi:hypothetical protein